MSEHDNGNNSEAEYHEQHHIVSPVTYAIILLILLVATATTVWASYIDLGEWHIAPGLTLFWNPVVALAIACTKMTFVVLFFMHIKYSRKLTKLTVISGLFIFLVLIGMTLSDYFSRAWGRW
ncbi:MAG TPA: cytochrome C oxidase subunit IV family protein [Terracidiphilus sp.]|nr:cytochrome C oxidase subunit IV family protein [Terracidiphilus sp.]